MELHEQEKKVALLKEKLERHEQILIQAYKSLKQKELELKQLNNALRASEEEIKTKNEELLTVNDRLIKINEELYNKNAIIENQNAELEATILQLKETQAALLQSEKLASLGVLAAGVAHEINNPLNYIMGAYVGLENINAEKSFEENADIIPVLLNSLKAGVERASNIVTGLNQFSRNTKSHEEECDLHAIIDNCIVLLHNQIKHRIVIEKQYYSSHINLRGNVGDLHQVFLNIINNAIQAIREKGEIIIKSIIANQKVQITINDNGEGISPENLNKITDPFFTTKDPGKGTGLGLSITYNIIKNHNGTLEFQSEIGKGTTVTIKLPIN
jgi:signal transduction histidine kinase